MTLTTALPALFMAAMGLSLLAYVLQDGHRLGLGLLMPFASPQEQDALLGRLTPCPVAPEAWLLLATALLWVCFPAAHAVVLPAVIPPLAVMVAGLLLRGLALGWHARATTPASQPTAGPERPGRRLGQRMYAAGTLLAAVAQGWMLGTYVTGFHQDHWGRWFCTGIAITLPAAYAMQGVGWLVMQTQGALQRKALAWGQGALWPMGFALMGISLVTPVLSPTVFAKWFTLPGLLVLLPIPVACAAAFLTIRHVLAAPRLVEAGYGWLVNAATVLMVVLAFGGLAYSLFPYLVMDRLSLWQAAGPAPSVLQWGVGLLLTLMAAGLGAHQAVRWRVGWRRTGS